MRVFAVAVRIGLAIFATLALVVVFAAMANAQSAGTGSIGGVLKDPKGLLIPGASVVVRNVDTGAERDLTSNDEGIYSAPYLQPGRYEVRVKKEGFAEVVHKDLTLEVGQILAVDFNMQIKTSEQTVNVSAEVIRVDTEKSSVGQTVAQYQVENLPLNGRRWDNLVLLTPGVNEDGGFGGISFRGISSLYNNNMVDGADNNQAFFSEARGRTRLPYGYSLDAIKEFNVTTAAYTAEYGRAAGGIVNAVTKSGTNDWHGDAFYFIRDDLWLARDPIANASGVAKPSERRQQFGGALGGPVVHDKLFLFANYDQQKHNFPAVITHDPNFFDPTSAGSAAQTCEAGASPAILKGCMDTLAALKPLFNAQLPRTGDNYIGLGKVDYQYNSNNRISGVLNILRWKSLNGISTSPTTSSAQIGTGSDQVNNEFVNVTWSSVIKPTLVNEARFQYGRDFELEPSNHSGPAFTLSDFGGDDIGMPSFLPRGAFPNEKRYQWVDNLSWIRNRHEFKFGVDVNHVRDDIQNLFLGGGEYGFPDLLSLVTDLVNASTATPTQSYDSITQTVDPITINGVGSFATNEFNAYFQDNFKFRPGLTFNFGVRYEIEMMPGIVKANPTIPESAVLNTDKSDIAPRVGFAWDIGATHKQVIRGGYGIYYGRTQNSSIFAHLFQNGIFQQSFRFSPGDCGAPIAPNTVFPQPNTAPAFGPIFGSSGPTPAAEFATLAAFQAACAGQSGSAPIATLLGPHFVNPRIHEYDIAYERELPFNLTLTASYVGSRGTHLPVFYDNNLNPPDTTKSYLIFDGSGNPMSPTSFTVPFFSGVAARPRAAQGVTGPLLMGQSVINSWYNGLVLRLRRRESHGLSFDANFTLSKSWDNGEVSGVNGTFTGTVSPINPFNLRGEYGRSELDIRKRFIMNLVWRTPFADWTENEGMKKVVGGWMVSSVWHIQDGRPATANMNFGLPRCGRFADGGLTCGTSSSRGSSFTGRAAFIERNSQFETPGLVTFDLRFGREFRITERTSFEGFVEAFNLFNHTNAVPSSSPGVNTNAFNFVGPGRNLVAGGAIKCPTAAMVPTIPDFRGCVQKRQPPVVGASSAFLAITNTSNNLYTARQLQFGGRFRF